jgi:glycosyltransferase involved in cell wall biosynthesis
MHLGFDLRRMNDTGIGRYSRCLFSALVTLRPEYRYTVAVQDVSGAEWVERTCPGGRVVIAPAARYTVREMASVPVLDGGIDLWHSPHPFQLDLGRRAPRLVLTLHDLIPVTHPHSAYARRRRPIFREFVRLACRRAHALVADSAFTRDEFVRLLGVPASKVTVVHLAPAGDFAVSCTDRSPDTPALTPPYALYVGTAEAHKNVPVLLRSIARLRELVGRTHRWSVALIGPTEGPFVRAQRAVLEQEVAALGIGDRVHFLGTVSDGVLRAAYRGAVALVQPSLVEGFGLTVVEAMAVGTPVIAADTPVFREVAGDAALFFPPDSADALAQRLQELLEHPGLRAAQVARGVSQARSYGWERAARETDRVYRGVLNGSDEAQR